MKEMKFLSIQMVSDYTHLSKSTLYKKVHNNSIPHIKLGRRTLFERELVDQWVRNGGKMEDNLPKLPKL